MDFHDEMKKTIHRAQHCQRNWDLNKEIPKEDLDLFVEAVTQCPSKQNIAFYNVHFVSNREVIEKLHSQTHGAVVNFAPWTSVTNSQVLANLVVVFEQSDFEIKLKHDRLRNVQTMELVDTHGNPSSETAWILERDMNLAVGVAAGFLNVVANGLGYSTGCCNCMNVDGIQEVLGLKKHPVLMMGIGFKDGDRPRRKHHLDDSVTFPTKPKQKIQVNFIP